MSRKYICVQPTCPENIYVYNLHVQKIYMTRKYIMRSFTQSLTKMVTESKQNESNIFLF